jgi:hypothetical protein
LHIIISEFSETTFAQYLSSDGQQLTGKLRHYILHALAMVSPTAKTVDASSDLCCFINSDL